jgi:hypothetical protein
MRSLRGDAGGGASASPTIIARRALRLSPLGFADVRLGCRVDAFGACAGELTLQAAHTVRCGGARIPAGARLGSTSFQVAAAPALAPVRLRAVARAVVRCAGRIRARAGASDHTTRSAPAELEIRAR